MNKIRGEAGLVVGGTTYRMLLTLGALAEIEDGLGLADLGKIGERMKAMRAGDLAIVAAALLRGGGHDMTPDAVLALPCELGALVQAVTEAFDGGIPRPFAGATRSASD